MSRNIRFRSGSALSLAMLLGFTCYCQTPGTWTALKNKAPSAGTQPHLLSDGTVMWLSASNPKWMRLAPDAQGSYVNGTWSMDIAPMSTPRLAFASNMLTSGKLLVLGGEFSGTALVIDRVGTGEIYDPVANTWTPIPNPPPVPQCPFQSQFGGTLTNGSPVVTHMDQPGTGTAHIQAGWTVTGTGVPAGTTILSVDSAEQITLSQNATVSGDFKLTFSIVTTGNITAGSIYITGVPSTTPLLVGSKLSGNGIPTSGAYIWQVVSPTEINMGVKATATANGVTITIDIGYQPPTCIGDSPSMLLPNGKVLLGGLTSQTPQFTFLYDPVSNAWSAGPAKFDNSAEASWVQLDNGVILTYDVLKSAKAAISYAEIYDPTTNKWSDISPSDSAANGTLPLLTSLALGIEIGPSLRLQDGRAIVIGATGHTALYTPSTNTWAAGPDIVG